MSEMVEDTQEPKMDFSTSRQFVSWMIEQNISIGFTTYQSGKVFLLGHNDQNELSIFERTFERPMGLWSDGQTILLSSLYQIFRFENVLLDGQLSDGYDKLYVPRRSYITGDLDIHDISMDAATDEPIFINTLFGCIATTSMKHSFKPLWQPDFVTELSPEDRCHMNGLALEDGKPAYVTAISTTNVADGWRDHRRDGGVIIDVKTGEIVCKGLSMPHSPRLHNGKLWVANSGTGEFGWVDLDAGKFEPIAFCPGYIRGVSFHGDFAIVGLSKPRGNKTFEGLALEERLTAERVNARCGLYVIDLKTGATPHWLHASGIVTELYDVITMPGVKRPSLIGFRNDQIRRILSIDEQVVGAADSQTSALELKEGAEPEETIEQKEMSFKKDKKSGKKKK